MQVKTSGKSTALKLFCPFCCVRLRWKRMTAGSLSRNRCLQTSAGPRRPHVAGHTRSLIPYSLKSLSSMPGKLGCFALPTTSFTHGYRSRTSDTAEQPLQNNLLRTMLLDTTPGRTLIAHLLSLEGYCLPRKFECLPVESKTRTYHGPVASGRTAGWRGGVGQD